MTELCDVQFVNFRLTLDIKWVIGIRDHACWNEMLRFFIYLILFFESLHYDS